MSKPLVNKVAKKAIVSFNAADYIPSNVVAFDLKPFLFKELLLKEKEFRSALKEFDFSPFEGTHTYITCTSSAIIPMWGYMLAASHLQGIATKVIHATNKEEAMERFIIQGIESMETSQFMDKRLVIKGCGEKAITINVYIALMQKLQPITKAINFGEACSMVPVFKKTK